MKCEWKALLKFLMLLQWRWHARTHTDQDSLRCYAVCQGTWHSHFNSSICQRFSKQIHLQREKQNWHLVHQSHLQDHIINAHKCACRCNVYVFKYFCPYTASSKDSKDLKTKPNVSCNPLRWHCIKNQCQFIAKVIFFSLPYRVGLDHSK